MISSTEIVSLAELSPGTDCRIVSLELKGLLRRRLQDLGIVPGTMIGCIRRGPSGEPTAYLVRGAMIALRKEDAGQILVMPTYVAFREEIV